MDTGLIVCAIGRPSDLGNKAHEYYRVGKAVLAVAQLDGVRRDFVDLGI